MRHGNPRGLPAVCYDVWAIPILPMRHGNPFVIKPEGVKLENSDPTYEAWKPSFWFLYFKLK